MVRIGLPRALEYHRFGPLWEDFLQRLEVEVVPSPETTRETVEIGVRLASAKLCLPVKVYCGQVAVLSDRAEALFVPVTTAVFPQTTRCARLLGLAEMVRMLVPGVLPMAVAQIDLPRRQLEMRWPDSQARRLLRWPGRTVGAAWEAALASWEESMGAGLPLPPPSSEGRLRIGVAGHLYLLADPYVNHRLLARLGAMGAEVLTPDRIPAAALQRGWRSLARQPYWGCEGELLGVAGYSLEHGMDGLIVVTAFSCGPDAALVMTIQRACREHGMPCLILTLDEHSGTAGLTTRLEAFVDTLERRRRHAHVSRPGRGIGEHQAGPAR
jgi:predicted nucleotide-binding protein (sugar kinase/HSP70/actin superfamily)